MQHTWSESVSLSHKNCSVVREDSDSRRGRLFSFHIYHHVCRRKRSKHGTDVPAYYCYLRTTNYTIFMRKDSLKYFRCSTHMPSIVETQNARSRKNFIGVKVLIILTPWYMRWTIEIRSFPCHFPNLSTTRRAPRMSRCFWCGDWCNNRFTGDLITREH